MAYIRKHYMNILLFLLWIGMAASLVTANADVQGGGAAREDHSAPVSSLPVSE